MGRVVGRSRDTATSDVARGAAILAAGVILGAVLDATASGRLAADAAAPVIAAAVGVLLYLARDR